MHTHTHRVLLALREKDGGWERSRLCMGDQSVCTGDLVGEERNRYLLSFGEDEDGELYVLTSSRPSPTNTAGVVYQLVDPARQVDSLIAYL